MSNSKILWVLRSERGQLRGPYETQVILKMIKDGTLSGDEMIARYPDGNWVTISREPQFYDQLLNALSKSAKEANDDKVIKDVHSEETVVIPPPSETSFRQQERTANTGPSSVTPPSIPKPPSPVIDLSNMKKIEAEQKLKVMWKPLAGIILVLVIAAGLFLMPDGETGGKIRLIAPRAGSETLGDADKKTKLKQALADIQKDTPESYVEAQNKLVSLIEGAPRDLSARALLCVVYKELWPYSFQDEKDLKTVTDFSQATKNLNLISVQGNICETVKLMTLGRVSQARGAVDNMFNNPDDDAFLSVVYLLKGELLKFDRDYSNAQAFFEDAAKKGKDWLKPRSALALLMLETKQYAPAIEIFNSILKSNPKHKAAQIGIGIALFEGYKKSEESQQWLQSALGSGNLAPRELEAQGYFSLAQILVDRGDKRGAKEAAEQAFERNPQSEKIKDLLVRLGGVAKVNGSSSQKNELIFLGDQYSRQGDCFSAQAQYKTAFELDPTNGTAAMKAAKCLWQLHQSYEAIEWLKKATKADPNLVSAYVLQADYLSQRYDFYGALQILTSVRRIAPSSYEVQRGFAQVEFRKNNLEGAINYGQKALALFQGDVENLILLSQANIYLAKKILPNSPKEIEARNKAIDDAVKYALKAVEIDGSNVDANKNYAVIMAMTNGVDAGIKILEELIKKYSFSYEYRVALGDLLRGEQRMDQAAKIYEQVVDVDPKNKDAFIGLGDCYRAQKEINKSLKAFLSASTLDPSDAKPIFEIGRLYLDTQRFDEAIKYFDRVSKINPNFPKTHYFIAKSAFLAGNFALAQEEIKKEKKNNPYLSDSYILAGEIHEALKQYNECSNEYAQALKLRSQPASVYVNAARCYRLGSSVDIAEDMLSIASQRESGYAEIYREQGAIYQTKGERQPAIKAYCLYLELSPNAPDKKMVETRLGELGFSSQNCNTH
jgi:tetratricopeptide (TPR) repeat protein